MNYIIFDPEWNPSTDDRSTVLEPVYLSGEIAEFGAVKLNDQFCLVDEFFLYITPMYYKKMHHWIAMVTGI